MEYKDLKSIFCDHERRQLFKKPSDRTHLTARIVFAENSFDKELSVKERTYILSSDNNAFIPAKKGNNIIASALVDSNKKSDLKDHLKNELGGVNGWKIEEITIV